MCGRSWKPGVAMAIILDELIINFASAQYVSFRSSDAGS